MFVSAFWGVTISLVALRTLVAGDPTSILTIYNAKVTTNPNDYFDPWSVEIIEGKGRSSMFDAKIPMKKEIPENLQVQFYIKMDGQDPVEYTSSFCEGMEEEMVGKTMVNAGVPKGTFPKNCPFIAGNWAISKWDPPVYKIPPGVPDGRFTGYIHFVEEGKEPYVQIEYEGELSHGLPSPFGR